MELDVTIFVNSSDLSCSKWNAQHVVTSLHVRPTRAPLGLLAGFKVDDNRCATVSVVNVGLLKLLLTLGY